MKEKLPGTTFEITRSEYDEIISTIKSLRSEVQSLKATIAKENVTDGIDENAVSINLSVTTPAPDIATNSIQPFYLAIPIGANLFSAEDKSTNPLPDSMYKFSGGSTGTFEIFSSNIQDFRVPFNSHDLYFKPVCDYSNALELARHRGIRTLVPGKYRILGSEISVTEKAKIEFI